jgi:hypothetical protein
MLHLVNLNFVQMVSVTPVKLAAHAQQIVEHVQVTIPEIQQAVVVLVRQQQALTFLHQVLSQRC